MHVNVAKVTFKSLLKVTEVYILCVLLLTLQCERMTEMYSYPQGGDGVEYLYIPVDSATLKQFIEDQQNNNVG